MTLALALPDGRVLVPIRGVVWHDDGAVSYRVGEVETTLAATSPEAEQFRLLFGIGRGAPKRDR